MYIKQTLKFNILTILVGLALLFNLWDYYLIEKFNYGLSSLIYIIVIIFSLLIGIKIKTKLVLLYLAFITYMLFVSLFSEYISISVYRVALFTLWCGFCLIIYSSKDFLDFRVVLNIALYGSIFYLLPVLLYGDYSHARLSSNEIFNPSWIAYQSAILFFLLLLKTNISVFSRIIYSAPILLTIILTQGRTALGSIILSLILAYTIDNKKRMIIIPVIIFFIYVFIMTNETIILDFLSSFYEGYFNRFINLFSSDPDVVTAGRVTLWKESLSIYINSENIMPIGINQTWPVYGFNSPHNIYIKLLNELGIVFLAMYLLILFYILFYLIKTKKSITLKSFWIFFIVSGIGNDVFFYKYFWYGMASFIVAYHLDSYNHNNEKKFNNNIY
jgi:hypothetical protein